MLIYSLTLIILLSYQRACPAAADKKIHERGVFFLSDLLKEINKPKLSEQSNGVTLGLKSSLDSFNSQHMSQTQAEPSRCQLRSEQHILRVSQYCEEIFYTAFRCDGHCPSSAFFYADEEMNRVQSCSMMNVKRGQRRLYCERKLVASEVDSFYDKYPDVNVVFQKSFAESRWSLMSPFGGFANYKGYYVIDTLESVSCGCKRI